MQGRMHEIDTRVDDRHYLAVAAKRFRRFARMNDGNPRLVGVNGQYPVVGEIHDRPVGHDIAQRFKLGEFDLGAGFRLGGVELGVRFDVDDASFGSEGAQDSLRQWGWCTDRIVNLRRFFPASQDREPVLGRQRSNACSQREVNHILRGGRRRGAPQEVRGEKQAPQKIAKRAGRSRRRSYQGKCSVHRWFS